MLLNKNSMRSIIQLHQNIQNLMFIRIMNICYPNYKIRFLISMKQILPTTISNYTIGLIHIGVKSVRLSTQPHQLQKRLSFMIR
ncbi:hypothetical protein FGO68_gene9555 [Halteria grandinella]|uniref:Uncharacterized protein n=1 Tax=Halteria grandinella TaxID=5974 RepID=A0A8J8T2S8_HALGN|nr:hypothetical protein FGO68_gene9555 [Halteria grandinella]